MPDITIEKTLVRLEKMERDSDLCTNFYPPIDSQKLAYFEKKMGVPLPISYQKFLLKFNGGMFLDAYYSGKTAIQIDLESCEANTVYLLGIEEIAERYAELSSRSWKMNSEKACPYPIIPFCSLPNSELLVFVHSKKAGSESPVFDAYHEEFPETWGIVANDFTNFLAQYLDAMGSPETMGDEELGVVADYLDEQMGYSDGAYVESMEIDGEKDVPEENEFALYERAIGLKDAGNYKEAYELISKAIELNMRDPFYHFIRGEILTETEQHRAALIDFDIAVKLAPKDTLYLCCRAGSLFKLNKVKAAFDDCNMAIEEDSRYVLAYMMRKEIYEFMGIEDKAEADQRIIDRLDAEEN